ncbi:hypothetical protein M2R48_08130 [Acinetobacter sp. I-MWF]|uniref:hypothetical protein n=1 Tax=Acinetobacter sp. I-MWF TaxID=2940517 RepID=UPI0021C652C7|nr:hypothetical protein [Acinetobacter sp. I-MWF]MCT9978289.1 hypothetical protein [Acinetobacter sp. I-MWF]
MDKSEHYYRLAANQDHENAQLQLALILLNKDKNKNLKEAIFWLKKVEKQGNTEAQDKLKELDQAE